MTYAVIKNNIVENVIVADEEFANCLVGVDSLLNE